MKYAEQGRKLILTFGEGDDIIEMTIQPLPSAKGRELTNLWLEVAFPALAAVGLNMSLEDVEKAAEELVTLALGAENEATLEQLRLQEQAEAIAAAVMWNGVEADDALLKTLVNDGYPAARSAYATRLGFGEAVTVAMNQANLRIAQERAAQATGAGDGPTSDGLSAEASDAA